MVAGYQATTCRYFQFANLWGGQKGWVIALSVKDGVSKAVNCYAALIIFISGQLQAVAPI
jgi:hypothetical protein